MYMKKIKPQQKQSKKVFSTNTSFFTFFKIYDVIFYYYINMNFGENLRRELEFQDIQIKELSIKTGISKNTIDKYLSKNQSSPSVENALKIAYALGVTVEYLASEKDEISKRNKMQDSSFLQNFSKLSKTNKTIIKDLIQIIISKQ